jgi:hypothetical protein
VFVLAFLSVGARKFDLQHVPTEMCEAKGLRGATGSAFVRGGVMEAAYITVINPASIVKVISRLHPGLELKLMLALCMQECSHMHNIAPSLL